MKRRYKKLLSVLGACVLSVPFAGCETDAEEVVVIQTNTISAGTSTNSSGVIVAGSDAPGTNATALAATEEGGTNGVSEQILQRIPPQIPADVKLSRGVTEVVKMLQAKGIQIARRTVAKYRDQLGILPARMRKRV